MNIRTLLVAAVLVAVPAFGAAQSTKNLDKKLKIHPRRLAFNNKDGRHQPRIQSRKDRHHTRKTVRKVTHQLATPHKPNKKSN